MRRIHSHIQLLAVLVSLCLAGQSLGASASWGATGGTSLSSAQKAELDKQVQEQLAKAEAGGSTGSSSLTGGSSLAGGASSAAGAALGGASSGASDLGGSSEAFSNLTQQAQPEEEEPTKTTGSASSTSSSGISTGVLIPIFIAGLLLLGGIAFLILRDARSVAPVGDMLNGNSAHDRAVRQRKRRAKAKAARQQRKRNR